MHWNESVTLRFDWAVKMILYLLKGLEIRWRLTSAILLCDNWCDNSLGNSLSNERALWVFRCVFIGFLACIYNTISGDTARTRNIFYPRGIFNLWRDCMLGSSCSFWHRTACFVCLISFNIHLILFSQFSPICSPPGGPQYSSFLKFHQKHIYIFTFNIILY